MHLQFFGPAGFCILGVLLIVLSLPPVFFRVWHVGVWLPLSAGGILTGYGLMRELSLLEGSFWEKTDAVIEALSAAGILAFVVLACWMALGYRRCPAQSREPRTVIVLGCKVRGTRPTKMLQRRLERAVSLLNQHPDWSCVVSGGQGADEEYPESWVMKRYLESRGIDKNRIWEEPKSENTRQNILFSQKVQQQNQLPRPVVVVTDSYHLYRGCFYARRQGMEVQGAACFTNPLLWFPYVIREMLGLLKAWTCR